MDKIFRIISFLLLVSLPLIFSTCKDEPDKPSIVSLSPATGKEGDPIVINGAFLGSTNKIVFGSVQALVVNPTGGQVTTQVPPNTPLGKVSVTVTTKGGTSNAVDFTVLPSAPVITTLSPLSAATGTELTFTGKYFTTVTEVDFGTTKVTTFDSKTETQLSLKIPDGLALGAINITVVNPGGISDPSSFTVLGVPVVSSFSPAAGPAGTHIFITGSNLADVTDVVFNTQSATFVITNATQIDAVVPPTATSGKIKITGPGGQGLSTSDFVVKSPPSITSFTPSSGNIGSTVTITGLNFNIAGVKVRFGGILAAAPSVTSDTQLQAVVPAGAATGKISVETPAGTATSTGIFTVVGAPTITSFSPTTGSTGASVTVTGSAFVNVTGVKFNGTDVGSGNFTVNSATQITTKVPTGSTSGVISVTSPSGTGTSISNFTIIGLPTVTLFSPASGIAGTSVTITGTSFVQVSAVKFNTTASTYTVNSPTQITATLPAGATTGKITVTNAAGSGLSANSFTLIQIPFISAITPATGLTGSTLTITGTSLANASSVKFGSTVVSSLISNTDAQIQVVVPASLGAGAVNVTVVTIGGTSNPKTFTVTLPVPVPKPTSIEPNVSYKGFPIMVLGTNLKNATAVNIGTTPATINTDYDGSMVVTLPASIGNGSFTLTVVNAGGASTGIPITIVTAPSGAGSPPAAGFVAAPPAGYVNVISNDWGAFLLTEFKPDDTFNSNCDFWIADDSNSCGHVTLLYDGQGNVTGNLIVLSRGTGATAETLYGQYSATVPDPCIQKMVLISAKTGKVIQAQVEVDAYSKYPSGTCH